LAEVLITLAIIGIIAAITIPSIVANHQKRELETRFAKGYRTLQQAINLATAEHGSIDSWDWDKSQGSAQDFVEFIKIYFLPYLNVARFCPNSTVEGCYTDDTYTRFNGTALNALSDKQYPRVILADGSAIQFYWKRNCIETKNKCIDINMDMNGFRKPNVFGLDIFQFAIYPQVNEFQPMGVYLDGSYNEEKDEFTRISAEDVYAACERKSTSKWSGYYCAARIVMDGFKINY